MPDIHSIISISAKDGIDVWALGTGTHIRSINASVHGSTTAPVLIDEEHIVVAQYDKPALLVINYKTGQVKTRSSIGENVKPICVSPDREYIAAGSASGKIYIWQVSTGELLRVFDAHYNGVTALSFSDDSVFLFSGGDDGILNVWMVGELLEAGMDDVGGRLSPFVEFSNHSLPITSIVCGSNSCGGGKIVTSSLDRTVKIFNLTSKSLISSFNFPSAVTCVTMDSAETFMCASCVDGNIYKVFLLSNTQTDQGSELSAGANISGLAKGGSLARASSKWNSSLWEGNRDLLSFVGHLKEVTSVSLSFDGSLLCSSSIDGTLRIWDVPTRQLIRSLAAQRGSYTSAKIIYDLHGALNLRNADMAKKQFPYFSKYPLPVLPLNDPLDTVRLGTNRGTVAIATFSPENME